jgi:ABC-type xylose transport system permease subunit
MTLKAIFRVRELTLLALILVICLAMTFVTPYFMSTANFRALSIGMVPTAIIAVGMTVLLHERHKIVVRKTIFSVTQMPNASRTKHDDEDEDDSRTSGFSPLCGKERE